jgi:glycosyltransferase involved in cell wall biosynthesis
VYTGNCGPQERDKLLGHAFALLHLINFDEPFGLSVAEAMCCGTPVIAFNRGAMPELILHKQTGFLVDTIDGAVHAVSQLPLINRKNCREWASHTFSAEEMTDDYIALYQYILRIE